VRKDMTKEQAINLYNSEFYKELTDYEKVKFQLFEKRLCMPFSIFHEAIEKVLGRFVYPHELDLNYESIVKEFLGECEKPSIEDIINLIPEDKRIIVKV
jgi:hypothetical protein